MKRGQERVFSRGSRKWIPVTKHRSGSYTSPNNINIGNGYMTGTNGYPILTVKHINADGTEVARVNGAYTPAVSYVDNDEIHVRVSSLEEISVFYIRYNQVKELLINLSDLVNTRTIGLRNNGIAGLGHVDVSNLHYLENLDLSGNSSVTDVTVSSQAPINFYYLGGTSIPQSTLDYVLQMAVDSGVVNGQMGYDGQPSASSQDNYDTLIDRGWQLSSEPVQVVAVNHTISAPIAFTATLQAPTVATPVVASVSPGVQAFTITQQVITVSTTDERPPSAVTGLTATVIGDDHIRVDWTDTERETSYEAWIGDKSTGTLKGILDPDSTAYTFTGLTAGTSYDLYIYAVNSYGETSAMITQSTSNSIDADYQAVLDYATANSIALPDSAQQTADNDFMVELKNSGAWARAASVMKLTGTASAAFKLIDWKKLVQRTAYGSITWDTNGALGNGANAYIVGADMSLETNFKAQDAGIFWNTHAVDPNTSGWYIMTGNYTADLDTRWYVIKPSSRVDVNSVSLTVTLSTGVHSAHHSGTTAKVYDNSGTLTSATNNMTKVPAGPFGILCRLLDDDSPASYSQDHIKCIIYGNDMSDIEGAVRTALGTV